MPFDIAMTVIGGLLILRGWFRGFYRSVAGTIGLVAGYGISYASARPLGDKLWGVYPSLPRPIAWSVAAFGVFILVNIVVMFIGDALLRARVRQMPEEERRPFLRQNRRGGACLGFLRGALLVAFISLAAALIPVGHAIGKTIGSEDSKLVTLVRPFVHPIIKQATAITVGDQESGEIMSAILRDPEAARNALEIVWQKEDFQALLADPEFVEKAQPGQPDDIVQDERMLRLMGDPDVQEALRDLGVDFGPDSNGSSGDTAKAVVRARKAMEELAPFFDAIRAAAKTDASAPATSTSSPDTAPPNIQEVIDTLAH